MSVPECIMSVQIRLITLEPSGRICVALITGCFYIYGYIYIYHAKTLKIIYNIYMYIYMGLFNIFIQFCIYIIIIITVQP